MHLVLHPVRLPLVPLDLGPARGVEVSLVTYLPLASVPLVSSSPSGAVEEEVACSQRTPPAHPASSVASPRSSQHALQRGESEESSVVRYRSRSSRVSQFLDRGTRKDRRARSRSHSSRDRSRRFRSRSAYR